MEIGVNANKRGLVFFFRVQRELSNANPPPTTTEPALSLHEQGRRLATSPMQRDRRQATGDRRTGRA